MTKFDLKTLAISTAGALALSVACVGAAIAPAHAAEATLAPAAWQQLVSDKVSSAGDILASGLARGKVARPVLALRFDAAGAFAGAEIRETSGIAAVDREALYVARTISYPALPAAYRGTPRTIEMRLAFGDAADIARDKVRTARVTMAARADGFQVAGR